MGKLKVSFTTALFVFSFIICVIVAVAFVDRAPQNDYDSFYEGDRAGDGRGSDEEKNADVDAWGSRNSAELQKSPQTLQPEPANDPNLVDLPIDSHLAGSVQPTAVSPAPAVVANPMSGRSPDDIARAIMGQAGINASLQAAGVPGMAVPAGISTPVGAIQSTPATSGYTPSAFLPLQSNTQRAAPPGIGNVPPPAGGYQGATGSAGAQGLYATPSLGGTSNAANQWNPVQASSAGNMLGVRSAPANPQQGMMISDGRSALGAVPPAGFEDTVTQDGAATPAAPPPVPGGLTGPTGFGGLDQPLLLAPQPESGSNKFELPPAPTLRPPPVQDPDRRRSDAESESPEAESPDSMNPDDSSGQAIAVSEETPQADEPAGDDPAIAASVKDTILTADQALRLAEVNFMLKDQTLTSKQRDEETEKAAAEWEEITLAAAVAEEAGLVVAAPDVEKYAAMRPDFDPAAWQSAMADKGFSEKEIRQNLTNIALSEKLVEQDFEKEFEAEAIRETYDKKPSQYATQRQVHLMEIFKEKPEDEKRAEKLAGDMRRLQRQAAAGTDFGLLARQASQAPTRGKGGNLGWITPAKDVDEDRDKALADLKPGEVTDVLEEPTGYRIYKLVDVKEATNDFEGGKDLVVAALKKSVREACFKGSREKLETEISAEEKIMTAMAKTSRPKATEAKATKDKSKKSSESDAAKPAQSAEDAETLARREKAQELLADLAARRRAAEKQQITGAIPQEPGTQNQVLYAPGTQVQQMAGGQPAPAYQAGGQLSNPVQNPLSAPESVSVNYPPDANMQMNPGEQTAGAPAQAPPAEPTPELSRSNGWLVSKKAGTPKSANQPQAAASTRTAPEPTAGEIPPGFEGSGSGSTAGNRQQGQSKGLVGNVKSFFGGLRK